MAKKKKANKNALKKRGDNVSIADEHVLDRLYDVIDSRKGADPDTSYTARLFSRGRQQIAKKLGEEAVETLIEGIRGRQAQARGRKRRHALPPADAVGGGRRQARQPYGRNWPGARACRALRRRRRGSRNSGHAALRSQQHLRPDPARRSPLHQGLRGRVRARLQRHLPQGAGSTCWRFPRASTSLLSTSRNRRRRK